MYKCQGKGLWLCVVSKKGVSGCSILCIACGGCVYKRYSGLSNIIHSIYSVYNVNQTMESKVESTDAGYESLQCTGKLCYLRDRFGEGGE